MGDSIHYKDINYGNIIHEKDITNNIKISHILYVELLKRYENYKDTMRYKDITHYKDIIYHNVIIHYNSDIKI